MSVKKKALMLIIAAVTFLTAALILFYPIFSTWYNDRHQAEVHVQFQEEVEQKNTAEVQQAKALAKAYNADIGSYVQEVESFSPEALDQAATDYDTLLNMTGSGIMGYVEIPSIGVNLPIYHGTDASTLEIGVGHLLGSSLPVGGESTHTILTAHSGMASKKMFSDLPQLKIGDVFFLEVLDETLAYQVDQIKTVLPYDTTYLGIAEGKDYCTLVTCTPFGINTHRLLVRGARIPFAEAEQILEEKIQDDTDDSISTWAQEYIKGIVIGLILVGFAAIILLVTFAIKHRLTNNH